MSRDINNKNQGIYCKFLGFYLIMMKPFIVEKAGT